MCINGLRPSYAESLFEKVGARHDRSAQCLRRKGLLATRVGTRHRIGVSPFKQLLRTICRSIAHCILLFKQQCFT